MSLHKNLSSTESFDLISKKQKKFIFQALAQTDKILSEEQKKKKYQEIKYKKSSIQLPTTIEQHYSLLLKCNQLKFGKIYRVSLQAYMQEYFCLDLNLHIFPITISILKISNQGILHIGFNKEYPGVQMKSFGSKKDLLNEYKYFIKKSEEIIIKPPPNRNVEKIYFMFVSNKRSLNLDFKVKETLNNQKQKQKEINYSKQKKKQAQLLATNFTNFKVQKRKIRVKTEISPKFSLTKASYLMRLQKLASLNQGTNQENIKFINFGKSQQQIYEQLGRKTFLKTNASQIFNSFKQKNKFSPTKTLYNNNSLSSFLRNSINFSSQQKCKISQENVKQLQLFKQKKEKLNKLASQNKNKILAQRTQYDIKKLKLKKLTLKLSTLLMTYKFMQKSHLLFLKRKKKLLSTFKITFMANKFIKNIKKQKKKSQHLVPSNLNRISYGLLPITKFLGNFLYQRAQDKAQKVIANSFKKLFAPLVILSLVGKSQKFVQQVVKIQKYYRIRLSSQKESIRIYSQKKLNKLLQNHPHLKKYLKKYRDQKVYKDLINTYLKDENIKHNQRIRQYRSELAQRQKFIRLKNELNDKKVSQFSNNKKKLQKNNSPPKKQEAFKKTLYITKAKFYYEQLQVPKIPVKPAKLIYRNLNILNTMVRNWFQLQNHIWVKQQRAKLWY